MIVLGVLLDFAQKFIPGRDFDWADIAANTVGVFAGLAVGRVILLVLRTPKFKRTVIVRSRFSRFSGV